MSQMGRTEISEMEAEIPEQGTNGDEWDQMNPIGSGNSRARQGKLPDSTSIGLEQSIPVFIVLMICLMTAFFTRWYFEDDNVDDEEIHMGRFAKKGKGVLGFVVPTHDVPVDDPIYGPLYQKAVPKYAKVSSSKNSPGFTDLPPSYISRSSTGSVRRRKSLQPSLPENLETSQSRQF
ncbi:hypothetical protein WR25_06269 [Diploscapter pachys]|uniref:Uncharacterized protein n=1 Tax=Diploscapter pachys TaxID=2018661 RepID=A0A2A2LX83_9BILA|nr:hypothetical protein WR25_06269 [Diploscapter pachys]